MGNIGYERKLIEAPQPPILGEPGFKVPRPLAPNSGGIKWMLRCFINGDLGGFQQLEYMTKYFTSGVLRRVGGESCSPPWRG